MTPEEKIQKAHIERYDHGGGRMWWEDEKGSKHLIADFYGDGDEMREHILALLGRAERKHDYTTPRCWCGEANHKATQASGEANGPGR